MSMPVPKARMVVDSGASKATWMMGSPGSTPTTYNSRGISPFFDTSESILELLKSSSELMAFQDVSFSLFFYGTGCSSPERNALIHDALQSFFRHAEIQVEHDLLGAVRASVGDHAGIVGILGTGSNACYFDGLQIHQKSPSLGFILGDEGSGASIGKRLARDFCYLQMPDHLHDFIHKQWQIDKEFILHQVYRGAQPSRYLATWVSLWDHFPNDPYLAEVANQAMEEFIRWHILPYHLLSQQFSLVGSIAWLFQDAIQRIAKTHHFQLFRVVRHPVEGLWAYHQNT